ncbi:uncharacterized protein LOC127242203 [Andrographis paniculata]|uniref:uncharacterized protein LOC127242203 n=1 Tax=Andrographis paniculata TaxID=175694 RepID=UPI0021E74820|nr:uncharacterized protein LOC127242203 [Andrographis paniculata]XP_051117614.1 uncharacterized protein LOC127242203 [Andrographis paniculata]
MAMEIQATAAEFLPRAEESSDESPETTSFSRHCCCFGRFKSRKSVWERISASEMEAESGDGGWWRGVVKALKKVREMSELAAGPKWKTFLRRFNRTDSYRSRMGKFQYDPSSYALNFDEGEVKEDRFHRDFSARYAAVNLQSNLLKKETTLSI